MIAGTWLSLILILLFPSWLGATAPVELNVQVGEEIRYLDPQRATGISSAHISINMFSGLYQYDARSGDPVPVLARSASPDKDFTVWTFKLRTDIPWVSDEKGKIRRHRNLRAADVVYSWRRMLSPELASEYAYMLYILKNGEAINTGKIKDLKQLGVVALDDETLQVTLEGPVPSLINYLPHHSFVVVPEEPITRHGDAWIRQGNIRTSGPFVFREWKLKDRITLVKNPFYPGQEQVQPELVHFRFIGTYSSEAVRAFRAGEIDIDLSSPPANELRALKKSGNLLLARQLGTYFVRINLNTPGLEKAAVRRALALTIPRKKIARYVLKGGQQPAWSFIPDSFKGYKPVVFASAKVPWKERVKEARRLLADAGYPGGKGLPEITYVYNTSETHKSIGVVLARNWQKELGIRVKPLNQEWKVYLKNQHMKNYEMQRSGWVADMDDPLNFAEMFITGGGNNNTGFSNKEYDRLITAARIEGDAGRRNELIAGAEKILMRELPVLPVVNYTSINMRQRYIKGLYANKFDQHPLAPVKIDLEARRKTFPARYSR